MEMNDDIDQPAGNHNEYIKPCTIWIHVYVLTLLWINFEIIVALLK